VVDAVKAREKTNALHMKRMIESIVCGRIVPDQCAAGCLAGRVSKV